MKINGLAYELMVTVNDTAGAIGALRVEQQAIRAAVVQHRMVFDLLTAQQGGVCKMINTSCCFYLPDFSANITDYMSHMRKAVIPPGTMQGGWWEWLSALLGHEMLRVWSLLAPIVMMILTILVLIPCFVSLVKHCIFKAIQVQATALSAFPVLPESDDDSRFEDLICFMVNFKLLALLSLLTLIRMF